MAAGLRLCFSLGAEWLAAGTISAPPRENHMKMTNVQSGSGNLRIRAVILTANKFEDMELMVPYFRLLDAGAHVDIASPTGLPQLIEVEAG
jgi:hypothetical protein